MGKNIIPQARGTGSPTYRAPSFRYLGKARFPSHAVKTGEIVELAHCPGHDAPLMTVQYEDGSTNLIQAPHGVKVGDHITCGGVPSRPGDVVMLQDIPEGSAVYNVESRPGDGGKFCRTGGCAARILAKTATYVIVQLPSKKERKFAPTCRAAFGSIAGSGRLEKPILKAGIHYHASRARNKLYPRVRAAAMNAVDHPFGNKRTGRKAKQKAINRFAPPGRKVGKLAPRRTGRRK